MSDVLFFLIGIPVVVIIGTIVYCLATIVLEALAAPVYLIETLIERRRNK